MIDAVTASTGELEELKDELQSWFDNLKESLQNGQTGSRLTEAIETLERVELVGVPKFVKDMPLSYHVFATRSRGQRRDLCAVRLRAVAEFVRERIDELEELADGCEETADEIDGIEFPGMYGR